MCHNKSTIVVLILLGMFVGTSASTLAQPGQSTGKECPPGVLSATIKMPPEGMANFQTIRLDENCRPIASPVQTVPLKQLPEIALDVDVRREVVEETDADERATGTRMKRVFRAEQAVLDLVNITLNKLYGKVNFKYDGSKILKFKASGDSLAHQENYPLSCESGWYLDIISMHRSAAESVQIPQASSSTASSATKAFSTARAQSITTSSATI